MDVVATFVTDREAAEAMEPGVRTFDHPAQAAEAAAMRRAPSGQDGDDALGAEAIAMRLRVVPSIALDDARLAPRATAAPAHGRERGDERVELRDVIDVRGRYLRDEGDAARVRDEVVLGPRLAAIGGVRSSFFPPRNARTELLSTMARARSSWPRRRSSARRAACRRRHTPARCQLASRRQHVLPDPQPISVGSICQGTPVRRTKRIPVSAARSDTRGRPMFLKRRRGGFGNNGSTRAHKASSIKRLDIRDRLALGHATVPIPPDQYKWHVNHF